MARYQPPVECKYSRLIRWSEEDHCYVCTIPELPGCSSVHDDPLMAAEESHGAVISWIEACRGAGNPVPEPDVIK